MAAESRGGHSIPVVLAGLVLVAGCSSGDGVGALVSSALWFGAARAKSRGRPSGLSGEPRRTRALRAAQRRTAVSPDLRAPVLLGCDAGTALDDAASQRRRRTPGDGRHGGSFGLDGDRVWVFVREPAPRLAARRRDRPGRSRLRRASADRTRRGDELGRVRRHPGAPGARGRIDRDEVPARGRRLRRRLVRCALGGRGPDLRVTREDAGAERRRSGSRPLRSEPR